MEHTFTIYICIDVVLNSLWPEHAYEGVSGVVI